MTVMGCSPTESACEALSEAVRVYTGKVVQVTPTGAYVNVRFEVGKVYRGSVGHVTTGRFLDTDCMGKFIIDGEYLVYEYNSFGGQYIRNRTGVISERGEDMQLLELLQTSHSTGRITGQIRGLTAKDIQMSTLAVKGASFERVLKLSDLGEYSLMVEKPGKYTIEISIPGNRLIREGESLSEPPYAVRESRGRTLLEYAAEFSLAGCDSRVFDVSQAKGKVAILSQQ